MKKIISLFPNLRSLTTYLWPGCKLNGKILEDIKRAHVKDWEPACPELESASFPDFSTFEKSKNEWKQM